MRDMTFNFRLAETGLEKLKRLSMETGQPRSEILRWLTRKAEVSPGIRVRGDVEMEPIRSKGPTL